jgi:hypothetical protein
VSAEIDVAFQFRAIAVLSISVGIRETFCDKGVINLFTGFDELVLGASQGGQDAFEGLWLERRGATPFAPVNPIPLAHQALASKIKGGLP